MSKQNDGGPAFPHWNQIGESGTPFPAGGGMTLRDWFAGQAVTLFQLNENNVESLQSGAKPQHNLVARFCYDLADAMLKAREETR